MITHQTLAFRLRDYLQHRITREALVDWAEGAMTDEGFDDRDLGALRDITARLALADVREFGLTWEDCEGYLSRLGYRTMARSCSIRLSHSTNWFELAQVRSTTNLRSTRLRGGCPP